LRKRGSGVERGSKVGSWGRNLLEKGNGICQTRKEFTEREENIGG